MNNNDETFKMPVEITESEMNQFRPKLIKFNSLLLGRRLIIPLSDNLDLNYKAKIKGDAEGLCTNKPLKKYYTETVDIVSSALAKNPDGKLVVIFNGDPKLQYALTGDTSAVMNATPQNVNDAILEYESNGTKTPFYDVRLVTEHLEGLNKLTIQAIDKFIDELACQSQALTNINKLAKTDMDEYLNSIG